MAMSFVLDRLKQSYKAAVLAVGSERGEDTAAISRAALHELCTFLRDDPQLRFAMLVDITAVDRGPRPPSRGRWQHSPAGLDHLAPRPWQVPPTDNGLDADDRFEVLYQLRSLHHGYRLRLSVSVPAADPRVPSVSGVWPGAAWPEREIFDLFGVVVEDHPDPRRLLLDEHFEGHPLRKDFPLRGRQALAEQRPVTDTFPTQADEPVEWTTPPR